MAVASGDMSGELFSRHMAALAPMLTATFAESLSRGLRDLAEGGLMSAGQICQLAAQLAEEHVPVGTPLINVLERLSPLLTRRVQLVRLCVSFYLRVPCRML
jgi:hypothetical protein